ncbi:hypothetical protein DRP04_10485 [Archaeoglobales archaeon]|nr:MAG: hypothetical protein DRP04_10485 [Archaeoglobales archaeon]
MLGVIPAAGLGKRMRPLTDDLPKPLLPVLNKPIIEHVIEHMRAVDVERIVVVIGYLGDKIKERLKAYDDTDIDIKFVKQEKLDGTVSAIKLAEKYIDEDFVVMWGDNFFRGNLNDLISSHVEKQAKISVMLEKAEKGARAYIERGRIVRVEERPKTAGGYAFAGVYVFNPGIFDFVDEVKKSEAGEYEISDLLQIAIDNGENINYAWLEGWRINVTTPLDLLKANLKALDYEGKPFFVGKDCRIEGKVVRSVIGNHVELKGKAVNSLIMDWSFVYGEIINVIVRTKGTVCGNYHCSTSIPCVI